MQADRFTVKAQEALAAAQRLAGARRNPEVAPYHLLARCSSRTAASSSGPAARERRSRARPQQANESLDALPTVTGDATARRRSAPS